MNTTLFCPGPTHTEFLQNSFTGNQGEKYNISTRPTDNRMTAQRCAVLMAIAIANKCELNFVGPFPSSPIMYISCYYPNLSKMFVRLDSLGFFSEPHRFYFSRVSKSFHFNFICSILSVFGKSGLTKFREANAAPAHSK